MAASAIIFDQVQSATFVGLRYTAPDKLNIQRKRSGRGFVYTDATDRRIKEQEALHRIRSLVIPPAWTSVRINSQPNGHIQAVGRDARGRKQYRYHPKYRAFRDAIKFDRMALFGKLLTKIRKALARDLKQPGLPKSKVLAAIVKLLETTYIRVGNEEYAQANGSFGLTTLRNRHVQIMGDTLKFNFSGKSSQKHKINLRDAQLARILRRCKDLPGRSLFEYMDSDGAPTAIDSGDVNEYLQQVTGDHFTAKDFRTWGGTCLAASLLLAELKSEEQKAENFVFVQVVKDVACKLGNKPATCRKYYIHPLILNSFSSGALHAAASECIGTRGGRHFERIVLKLLSANLPRTKAA